MAITPLPIPPSTSDPSTFATKADALLSALPTFVTEANALQTDVNAKQVTASTAAVDAVNAKLAAESFANATKWVSGTTYGEGDVTWSPTNFKPYRRKTTGAGATDPSLDTTNWAAIAYFDNEGAAVASATTTDIWATDGNTRHITGNVTITSFGTAPQAGARMKLIFDGTPQLTQSANLNLNAGGSNIIIEAGDWAEVYADTTTQFDVVVHRKSGAAIVGAITFASQSDYNTGTDTTKAVNSAILRANNLVAGTAIATTSGTAHDFTGIPSWVKRITLKLDGVSGSGTSNRLVQIGDSGGIENTGYSASAVSAVSAASAASAAQPGTGLQIETGGAVSAASLSYGIVIIELIGTNAWLLSSSISVSGITISCFANCSKALSGTLDRVRLTTVNGTDTFDAGSINIIYE